MSAKGNDKPLRVIKGPKTQLNWPTGIAFDADRRELFVANDMGPSILVFDANARGDVAPKRVLKGREDEAGEPDRRHAGSQERRAVGVELRQLTPPPPIRSPPQGDVAPLRTIRAAPETAPSLMIGNPGALTYDSKRQEILVPN